MAGTKEGALKARDTNIQNHGADFYKKIGSKSWKNPERSHKTGFALNPELAVEAGRKGGKKTKSEYKTQKEEWTTADELKEIIESQDDDSGVSE
ncbi:small hydrophilic plant seed protein [Caudoviricetes sp.]|nr:small hydrophilic plant seed protein [Caudoviricetes sp.]